MEFDHDRWLEFEDSSIEIMERLLLKGYVGPEDVSFLSASGLLLLTLQGA